MPTTRSSIADSNVGNNPDIAQGSHSNTEGHAHEATHESSINEGVATQVSSHSEPLMNLLAQLTDRVANSGTHNPRPFGHTQGPTRFSGNDHSKLQQFVQQCEVNFFARPSDFPTDRSKIAYAGTYLDGNALSWYALKVKEDPDSLNSWTEFANKLKQLFGNANEVAWAERQLSKLQMRPHQECIGYVTRFRNLINCLSWNDAAYVSAFKRGLPDRILDEIMRSSKHIDTLDAYIELALEIDRRYWEMQSYKEQRTGPQRARNFSTGNRDTATFPSHSKNQGTKKVDAKPQDSGKLNKDKKLTDTERERRVKLGLCMYCGNSGHLRAECPELIKKENSNSLAAAVTEDPKN